MIGNFLAKKYHKGFVAILILMFLSGAWGFFLLILLIYLILLLLFRRSRLSVQKESEMEEGTLFSPINGKVIKIESDFEHPVFGENLTMIRIAMPWWAEWGIYLPSASEVKEVSLVYNHEDFRYKKEIEVLKEAGPNGLCVTLLNKSQDTYGFQLVKCSFGGYPQVGVLPGDRGKQRANIGYFPLGGTLLLYVPENYKIMVSEKDILIAGVTIIGGE